MSGDVSRRERGPWKPERGQYVRLWPTRIAIPEVAGFTVVFTVVVALLIAVLLGAF